MFLPLWFRTVVIVGIIAAGTTCTVLADEVTSADATEPPVDLTGAFQGDCPHGQLSVDRECVTPPKIMKKIQAAYPKSARRRHVACKVVLSGTIEIDGTVQNIEVVNSTTPGEGFEGAAISAVKQWRWRPGLIAGKPVRVKLTVTTEFSYDD